MTTTRLTAVERREAVLEASLAEFAAHGYEGSSTEEIARRAGISQPYVFRLFGTKQNLFKVAVGRCLAEILDVFEHAAEGRQGRDALEAMAGSYIQLLHSRPWLLGCLHAARACDDRELGEMVRARCGELVAVVEGASGLSAGQVADFFARCLLIDFVTAMELEAWPEPWLERLLSGSTSLP